MKKKHHNGRRKPHHPAATPAAAQSAPAAPPPPTAPQGHTPSPSPDETQFDPAMVKHLMVATSLIEGRKVTREEVVEMLQRRMRQHSMAPNPPPRYGGGDMKQAPP